ncbi:MAG: CDP-alcohol phosphatidyltransferase family protein [Paludibacteraceae bacterium]|nr:CDP-alcohol phosphatidyltransferase family protein [Paludibacteraceae bacterium]
MEQQKQEVDGRREIASRNTGWANAIAHKLTVWDVAPNTISLMSIFFSMVGCALLLSTIFFGLNQYVAYVLFAACVQARLLCNLFDGMVAVEGGKRSANGDLYNDMPDRFADAFFIVPVGYVAGGWGVELGWLAAIGAIMTAYFRWIGAYKTHNHYFDGPMAKQHRMALLTGAALAAAVAAYWGYAQTIFLIALAVMNVGLIATLINRLYLMTHSTEKQ